MKLCIIGCGWIAMSSHGPALARYAAGRADVELAACCDPQIERAGHFCAAFGFKRSYCDAQEMIAAERPQAVWVLTPPPVTAEIAAGLLRQGIAVLMEKPPGLTLAEAEKLHAAARETGTPHLVAFNRRFTPLVQRYLAEFAARFQPGDIQYVRYEMARVGRTDEDFSTTAVHGIDAAAFLAASPYRRVEFHYQPLPALGANVANVTLRCALASGAEAHLAFLPVTGALTERAAVFLHDHAFYLELPLNGGYDYPGRLLYLEKGRRVLEVTGPQAAGGSEDWQLNGFYDENAAFLDALRAGRRPPAGVETTLQSVAIMEAMRARQSLWEVK